MTNQIKTILANGYTVSTAPVNGVWETMVFDADFEELEQQRHTDKDTAVLAHASFICIYFTETVDTQEHESKVVHITDHVPGVQVYYSEMGERKPNVQMEARLSHYGKHYFIDTPLELKGRGIEENKATWGDSCKKQIENWKSYKVTIKAFEKLKEQYPISIEMLLD